MEPQDSQHDQIEVWNYTVEKVRNRNPMNKNTLKGSQFETPLLEYNGALVFSSSVSKNGRIVA
ncbi:MAG: Pyruvate-flavodoxin oxidoreductase [Clostridium butyricum DORA_1]|nr:MAG: Pyruvate-flavodoxin oxidoreductase [Clostridium butyricum DORA_1]